MNLIRQLEKKPEVGKDRKVRKKDWGIIRKMVAKRDIITQAFTCSREPKMNIMNTYEHL